MLKVKHGEKEKNFYSISEAASIISANQYPPIPETVVRVLVVGDDVVLAEVFFLAASPEFPTRLVRVLIDLRSFLIILF